MTTTPSTTKKIPDGWRETTLGSVAELLTAQWQPNDGSYKYIGLEHINENSLSLNSIGKSDELASNKFHFQSGDILFGKLRPYFRKVIMPKFDGVCSTDIWVVRPLEDNNNKFLFYFLANPSFIDKAMGASKGTHMPRADWGYLSQELYLIPEPQEQKAIASVLSSFDDKIELLREQNKTLEAMAQALFKHWFVDFEFPNEDGKPYKSSGGKMVDSELGEIPEGWRVKSIEDITEVVTKGTTPTTFGKQFTDNGINFIKAETLTDNHEFDFSKLSFIDEETNNLLNRSKIKEKDILYTIAGTIGRFTVATEDIVPANTNQAVAIIRPNNQTGSDYLLCTFSLLSVKEALSTNILEAVQANLSLGSIKGLQIVIPNENGMSLFSKNITPLFQKKTINVSQIQTLAKTRDTLLPKLMRGDVRVKM